MIFCKKKMQKIGDLVKKGILSSINVGIMLAVMIGFTATDSYAKAKKLEDEVSTPANFLGSADNSDDKGQFGKKKPKKEDHKANDGKAIKNHGNDQSYKSPIGAKLLPISKDKLTVLKMAYSKKILGKFYLNKAKIEEALNKKIQIILPGQIILDKISDEKESKDETSGVIKTDLSGLPSMDMLSKKIADKEALKNPSNKLAALSDPDSGVGGNAQPSLLTQTASDNIVVAMQEFFTTVAAALETSIPLKTDVNGLKIIDLSDQGKFNDVMGKILLKSFDLKTNALFKNQEYIDLVYKSKFIKKLLEHFGNQALADKLDENADSQKFMTQLIHNNLLHFALKFEREAISLEISFSANNANKETDIINWNTIKNSLSEFATTANLIHDSPTVKKLYHHIIGKAVLINDISISGSIPVEKIFEGSSEIKESVDQVYLMVLKDAFKNSLKASLELENDVLDEAQTLDEFFDKLIDSKNRVKLGISNLLTVLENANEANLAELAEKFVNEVVIPALNTSKAKAADYKEGSLMRELVTAIGKNESDEGGNYAAYSLEDYLGFQSSGDQNIISSAVNQFKNDYTLAGNYLQILAKGGHQKRFASLAKSMIDSLSSSAQRLNLVLLVNNPNSFRTVFNKENKSIFPALYFGVPASEASLTAEEKTYLYKPDLGGVSYIKFNNVEESILKKLFSVITFDINKKIRLSVLSSKSSYYRGVSKFNLSGIAQSPITSNEYSDLNTLNTALNDKVDVANTYTLSNTASFEFNFPIPSFVVAGALSDMINVEALKSAFKENLVLKYVFGADNNFIWMKSKASKSLGKSALKGIQINFSDQATVEDMQFTYEGLYNILSGRIWYPIRPRGDGLLSINRLDVVNSRINNIGTELPFLKDPSPEATQKGLEVYQATEKALKNKAADKLQEVGDAYNIKKNYLQAAKKYGEAALEYAKTGDHFNEAVSYGKSAVAYINSGLLGKDGKAAYAFGFEADAWIKAKNFIKAVEAHEKEGAAWTSDKNPMKAVKAVEKEGDAWKANGNYETAAIQYEKAGDLYKESKSNLKAAILYWKQALTLDMTDVFSSMKAYNKCADAWAAGGQTARAADMYAKAAEKYKFFNLIDMSIEMGKKEDACRKGSCLPIEENP